MERYRLRHEPAARELALQGRLMPALHDSDHALCCVANGLDPDWEPDESGTVLSYVWPPEPDDDWK